MRLQAPPTASQDESGAGEQCPVLEAGCHWARPCGGLAAQQPLWQGEVQSSSSRCSSSRCSSSSGSSSSRWELQAPADASLDTAGRLDQQQQRLRTNRFYLLSEDIECPDTDQAVPRSSAVSDHPRSVCDGEAASASGAATGRGRGNDHTEGHAGWAKGDVRGQSLSERRARPSRSPKDRGAQGRGGRAGKAGKGPKPRTSGCAGKACGRGADSDGGKAEPDGSSGKAAMAEADDGKPELSNEARSDVCAGSLPGKTHGAGARATGELEFSAESARNPEPAKDRTGKASGSRAGSAGSDTKNIIEGGGTVSDARRQLVKLFSVLDPKTQGMSDADPLRVETEECLAQMESLILKAHQLTPDRFWQGYRSCTAQAQRLEKALW